MDVDKFFRERLAFHRSAHKRGLAVFARRLEVEFEDDVPDMIGPLAEHYKATPEEVVRVLFDLAIATAREPQL